MKRWQGIRLSRGLNRRSFKALCNFFNRRSVSARNSVTFPVKPSPLSHFQRVLGSLSAPAQKAGSRPGAVSHRGHGFPGFLFILGRGHPAGRPLCPRPGKPPATAFLPPSLMAADNCRLGLAMQSTKAECKWDNPTCLFTQPGDKGRKLFHINCPFFWHLEVSL